jgi:hypothetical protein
VYDGLVSNGYIVADIQRGFLVCAMENCPVLDVYIVADPDGMHVTANHCVEPYTAVIAHYNITGKCGIICQKAVFSHLREYAFY